MIENKVVTITKNNTFDKGWALFKIFNAGPTVNRAFKDIKLTDVVRAITYATSVRIILSERCLASRIVSELEWVNKHIKLNIIVKDKKLIESYTKLHFDNIEIDETIDFNYIGIVGKETLRVIFNDTFSLVDDTIEKVYFDNKKISSNYNFLEGVKSIFLLDRFGKIDYSKLVSEAKKYKCETYYVVSIKAFCRENFDFAKEKNITLLVSDYVGNGVVLVKENNELLGLTSLKDNVNVTYSIKDAFSYLGKQYKNCSFDDVIDCSKLIGEYYSCFNGVNEKLNINDVYKVENERKIAFMEDFINEVFDNSICNNHNDYSAKAKSVDYIFTLVPPVIDDSYRLSTIYEPIINLKKELKTINIIDFEKAIEEIKTFSEQESLPYVFDEINDWYKWFVNAVNEYKYKSYYSKTSNFLNLLRDTKNRLLVYCEQMFTELNIENSDTKFVKFDDEIAGYERQVVEKKALIEQGIDVLKNTSRVKTLEKKIGDLLSLKKRFEGTSYNRDSKELKSFIDKCNDVILGRYKVFDSDESIGQVLEKTEKTKMMMLNSFVTKYLYVLNEFLDKSIGIVEKLLAVEIPERYLVFEKEEQRYIVINELKEYELTKDTREKFNLLCLTRR